MIRIIAPLLLVLSTTSIALAQVVERVSVRTGGAQTAGLPGLPFKMVPLNTNWY